MPSGGGFLNGRIAYSSLTPDNFLEIIQGETKILTCIVEADGRFDEEVFDSITVKLQDPTGETVEKSDDDVTRVTEELDIQVFRVTLTPEETESLSEGLLKVEVAFSMVDEYDDPISIQKSMIEHTVKIIEAL